MFGVKLWSHSSILGRFVPNKPIPWQPVLNQPPLRELPAGGGGPLGRDPKCIACEHVKVPIIALTERAAVLTKESTCLSRPAGMSATEPVNGLQALLMLNQ